MFRDGTLGVLAGWDQRRLASPHECSPQLGAPTSRDSNRQGMGVAYVTPMPGPLESVSQIRREQLRALMTTWWWVGMVLVPIVAGGGAIVLLSNRNPAVVFLLAAVATVLAGLIGTYVLADRRAKSAFLPAWARSRVEGGRRHMAGVGHAAAA